jgi:hypothetical protein
MEFFKIINIQITEIELHQLISFENFNLLNETIFILNIENDAVNIGSIWGEFTLSRNEIKGGVRFALVECPNALTWSITTGYPPKKEQIILHLTINRMEIDQNFMEEINEFLDDWEIGLLQFFKNRPFELKNLNS